MIFTGIKKLFYFLKWRRIPSKNDGSGLPEKGFSKKIDLGYPVSSILRSSGYSSKRYETVKKSFVQTANFRHPSSLR